MTKHELGKGSFAVVKECRERNGEALFAAKVIRKAGGSEGLDRGKVLEQCRRLLRAADISVLTHTNRCLN